MKILLVLSNYPYSRGEAIEVVTHEIIRIMCKEGHEICIQVIIREGRGDANLERERAAREEWQSFSTIQFESTIHLADRVRRKGWLWRKFGFISEIIWALPVLRNRISGFLFPASRLAGDMKRLVDKSQPDILVGIWSWEALAATYAIDGIPKFMYYGNPDHKPEAARLRSPELFGIGTSTLRDKVWLRLLRTFNKAREVQHLRMMKHCDMTVNNSLIDAKYYEEAGHGRSIYLQNLWPRASSEFSLRQCRVLEKPFRVVASVGNLGATGNTFGLHFLGTKVAPRLLERFPDKEVFLDVYGQGTPSIKVADALKHPLIRLQGWVNDLDAEICTACAFLVLTNVSGFVVGNTRILLAWSLGCALVAHRDSALSMPEIVDGENALLGDSPDEIADAIVRLTESAELRARISRGGYETFREHYDSETVVPKMLELMKDCRRDYTMRLGNTIAEWMVAD